MAGASRTAILSAAVFLAGCAASPPTAPLVPLLQATPERPYERIGRLEVRGDPGEPLEYVHDDLRWQAGAMGADAVVKTGERMGVERAPAPYDPSGRPLLGEAYPGPLHDLEPGAFPPAGRDLRVRGAFYTVEGIAIRYVD